MTIDLLETQAIASTDIQLLDTHSAMVVGVVKTKAQAAVHIQIFRQTQSSQPGSGFVISSDGYLLTNHHVIEGATAITVTFLDGTQRNADFIGQHPHADLAILEVYDDLSNAFDMDRIVVC